jgi:S-adenosylmethionine synthetase
MRPYFIEQRLKLRNPIYSETAAYGHMGRTPETLQNFSAERLQFCYFSQIFVDQVKALFDCIDFSTVRENQLNCLVF